MAIFRLEGEDMSEARLLIAQETNLQLESHLENWLENSPRALAQDQESFLWIGRQPSARNEEGRIFPDLLGIDSKGNLVIVELKRDQAPRDVIAQLLEYAAWANELSDSEINKIAEAYFDTRDEFKGKTFSNAFREVFDILETDELPSLNRVLRLFVVAKEIPARVARVCRFLRTSHGMDIRCLDVSTFQTEAGEKLVGMETKVGDEDVVPSKTQGQRTSQTSRWSGNKPVKQVVWEAVLELTQGTADVEFTIREILKLIQEDNPDFKEGTVSAQITADTVNHPSRRHHSVTDNKYWRISTGRYRLNNPEKDTGQKVDD